MRIEFSEVAPRSGDGLLLPVLEGELGEPLLAGLGAPAAEWLRDARDTGRFNGRPGEALVVPGAGGSPRVIALGLGRRRDFDLVRLRNLIAVAADPVRRGGAPSLAIQVDSLLDFFADPASVVRALVEGASLANYERGEHRSVESALPRIETVVLVAIAADRALERAAREGAILGAATNQARSWQNRPGNLMRPDDLVDEARQWCEQKGLQLEVLDAGRLAEMGAGALLAVGQGSSQPARMLVIRHRREGATPAPHLGLVGKGVTFDTGGLSLKPSDGMQRMNYDMSGAAAVLAAMGAIAELDAPISVTAVCPVVENMVSGDAFRVGDVLTTLSGKTVEIISTDAEGRLILADALTHIQTLGVTHIVDAATLTGAIKFALGHVCGGAFPTDAGLMTALQRASAAAGERVWEMPMFADFGVGIKSSLADLKNSHGRPASSISAAFFLREFVGEVPWVHLDIAGAAWNDHVDLRAVPAGPTGYPTRTLAHLPWLLAAADQ